MTEAEWLACDDPEAMFRFAEDRVSERKLRLFSVACCRRVWRHLIDPRSRAAVEVAERFADGRATVAELDEAYRHASQAYTAGGEAFHGHRTDIERPHSISAHGAAVSLTQADAKSVDASRGAAYSTFHNISPYTDEELAGAVKPEQAAQLPLLRCVVGNPFRAAALDPAWRTSTVLALANGIYDEKAFDRTPILADALQDAGCENELMLDHLRHDEAHARGCWVVDLVLGKE
jgi:hypothetical protein